MNTAAIATVCSIFSAVLGFGLSYLNFQRIKKKDNVSIGETHGSITSDLNYIKIGIDELKIDARETRNTLNTVNERLTRVEERVSRAHQRIDDLKKDLNIQTK